MGRKLKVVVNGNSYDVEVDDLTAFSASVIVDEKKYKVEIESGGKGSIEPPSITAALKIPTVGVPAAQTVVPRTKVQATSSLSGNEVRAPMPGTILDIAVKSGEKVNVGQQLCALEAMKMKSAIRSPKEGVIASVEVNNGQKVAHGDVIVRYE